MEVASEEKRENTTIIAGAGPQWPSVWLLYVPESVEAVSAPAAGAAEALRASPGCRTHGSYVMLRSVGINLQGSTHCRGAREEEEDCGSVGLL